MSDWWGLAGKRVLVAGAGGIGLACLRALHAAEARLAAVDANERKLAAAAAEVPGLHVLTADVGAAESATAAVQDATRAMGGLDVLVHAVGVNVRRPILDTTDEDWQWMLATNLSSSFFLGRAAGQIMTTQGGGRIVFLSSVAGLMAHREHGPYAATKGGLNQLMRVMANEWAPHAVTVNAVAPGYTETELTADHLARPSVREHLTSLVPAGRLGTVEDIVGPVLFLASERAAFVTGHVLYVDGGRTLV